MFDSSRGHHVYEHATSYRHAELKLVVNAASLFVEAVEVHHLRPCGDEIAHELCLRVVLSVDL